MTIIITKSDYDYIDILGVFPTLKRALEYCKENDLKPQYHEFRKQIGETDFEYINVPAWCSKEGCQINKELQNFHHWHRMYCSPHYDNAIRQRKEQQRIYVLKDIEYKKQTEIDKQKRIEFEEKWDIKGYWWSDFVYEQLTEEETKKKVDYWKDSNNWMSGSSVTVAAAFPDDSEIVEGSAPSQPLNLKVTKTRVEPKKKDDHDNTFIMTQRYEQ